MRDNKMDRNPLQGRAETRMVELHKNSEPPPMLFKAPTGYELRRRPFTDFWVAADAQVAQARTGTRTQSE
jgi:hypothetical protein